MRADAEIAARPDPEQLQPAQRADQVAELVAAAKAGQVVAPTVERDEGRDREHRGRDREGNRLPEQLGAPAPGDEREDREEEWRQPDGAGEALDAGERRAGRRQRQHGPAASRRERPRRQRRDERDQPRAGNLLHAAPEDVAEQHRRLGRDHRERRPQPARVDHPLEQRVERQREQHRHERQVRLVEPGDVVGQQLVPDAQRHQRAGRVAERDGRRQRRLVGRGCEPGEGAPVLHHAIGHREVGRGVVELDVAGEGRLPGEDDRRREDGERPGSGGQRGKARQPAPRQREQQPDHREDHHERPRQLRRRVVQRRELRREHDEREARREHERPREPFAGQELEQPPAAEREAPEQERVRDPGDE